MTVSYTESFMHAQTSKNYVCSNNKVKIHHLKCQLKGDVFDLDFTGA